MNNAVSVTIKGIFFLLVLLGSLLVGIIIDTWMYSIPKLSYDIQAPSIYREHVQISASMTIKEVIKLFEKKVPPFHETDLDGKMVFSRREAGCIVEYDPVTKKVIKAYLDASFRAELSERAIW